MLSGKEIFKASEVPSNKCAELARDPAAAIALELESVSSHSPRIVSSGEMIARQIYSPIHLDEDDESKVTAAAFSDAADKGLSVDRLSYVPLSDIAKAGNIKAQRDRDAGKKREYIGVTAAHVADVRSIVDSHDAKRVYGVYDSALMDAIHHADVCRVVPEKDPTFAKGKNVLKKARRRALQECFGALRS
jgi:hypothetical protein